jgi:hypothetical protein
MLEYNLGLPTCSVMAVILYSLHKIPVLTRYYALLEVPGLDYWELLIEL